MSRLKNRVQRAAAHAGIEASDFHLLELWTEDQTRPGTFTCSTAPGVELDRDTLSKRHAGRRTSRGVSMMVFHMPSSTIDAIPGAVVLPDNGRDRLIGSQEMTQDHVQDGAPRQGVSHAVSQESGNA